MSSLAQIEKVMLLRSVDLFAHCSAEEVIRIAAIARERQFERGKEIYRAKDVPDALYCVVEGSVSLRSSNGNGKQLGTKEMFGVRSILRGRLRLLDAIASEDTVALAIEADDFFDLLSNNIEIVKALFREVMSESIEEAGGPS